MNAIQEEKITELIESTELFINAEDAAVILGSRPQDVREAARMKSTGFPAYVQNQRVKIPRVPFLRFLGVEVNHDFYVH